MEEIDSLKTKPIQLQGNTQGVYFLFDDDEVVYIGIGWNCLLRVAEHTRKDSNKKFTSWNFMPIDNEEELREVELSLIKKYKPKYNVSHNNQSNHDNLHMGKVSEKICSICGEWKPMSAFDYGNRSNRSYCETCNSEDRAAYSKGGKDAAREFRERKRRESGV